MTSQHVEADKAYLKRSSTEAPPQAVRRRGFIAKQMCSPKRGRAALSAPR